MPFSSLSALSPSLTSRRQRRLRNLLLDRQLQLKYSAIFAGIALFVGSVLGVVLWRASGQAIYQSRASVQLGSELVQQGHALIRESEKVNTVVRMSMIDAYGDDPGLLDVFQSEAARRDELLVGSQKALEAHGHALLAHAQAIEREHAIFGAVLIGGLLSFVVLIGLMGLWLTHKVAGPVHKLKRMLEALGSGHFKVQARLRRGDELEAIFDCFNQTAAQLRVRQERELSLISQALSDLADSPSEPSSPAGVAAAQAGLQRLHDEMGSSLATIPPGL